jgi:hypothetical protein
MTQKVQHFRVIDAERNIGVFVTMTEEESGCLSETFDAWDSAKRSQPVETVSRRSVMAVLRKSQWGNILTEHYDGILRLADSEDTAS